MCFSKVQKAAEGIRILMSVQESRDVKSYDSLPCLSRIPPLRIWVVIDKVLRQVGEKLEI
jgi:hypothetical protein